MQTIMDKRTWKISDIGGSNARTVTLDEYRAEINAAKATASAIYAANAAKVRAAITKVNAAIERAAAITDINDACLTIQNALGVEYGDVAGIFFSGTDEKAFSTLSTDERRELLKRYVEAERAYSRNGEQ